MLLKNTLVALSVVLDFFNSSMGNCREEGRTPGGLELALFTCRFADVVKNQSWAGLDRQGSCGTAKYADGCEAWLLMAVRRGCREVWTRWSCG
ncbi:hypothetical protein NL676_020384 [Syzygium grande]|nr:hypothetical protein NL676_020384 [Syzygium grande]